MSVRLAFIALACLLTGCAHTTAEFLIGNQISDGGFYPGSGITGTFRLRRAITDRTWCEYEHVSHVFAGPPFGPEDPIADDNWLDHVSCGIRFGGD